MKKAELVKLLVKNGWWLYDQGAGHEKWTDGTRKTTIPRHKEITENTAKNIIKTCGLK